MIVCYTCQVKLFQVVFANNVCYYKSTNNLYNILLTSCIHNFMSSPHTNSTVCHKSQASLISRLCHSFNALYSAHCNLWGFIIISSTVTITNTEAFTAHHVGQRTLILDSKSRSLWPRWISGFVCEWDRFSCQASLISGLDNTVQ